MELVVGQGGFNLAGKAAEGIRVVGPTGKEHLFYLRGPSGRRTGPIVNGDTLDFAVDIIPSGQTHTYWVYADNPTATDPDEFLGYFTNGDFEQGDVANYWPKRWFTMYTDDLHDAAYSRNEGINDSRCVRLDVKPGGDSTDYFFWGQEGIRLLPNHTYTVSGWIRYENVVPNDWAGLSVIAANAAGQNVFGLYENWVPFHGTSKGWTQFSIEFDSRALNREGRRQDVPGGGPERNDRESVVRQHHGSRTTVDSRAPTADRGLRRCRGNSPPLHPIGRRYLGTPPAGHLEGASGRSRAELRVGDRRCPESGAHRRP